jgi:hypothetical protein
MPCQTISNPKNAGIFFKDPTDAFGRIPRDLTDIV